MFELFNSYAEGREICRDKKRDGETAEGENERNELNMKDVRREEA